MNRVRGGYTPATRSRMCGAPLSNVCSSSRPQTRRREGLAPSDMARMASTHAPCGLQRRRRAPGTDAANIARANTAPTRPSPRRLSSSPSPRRPPASASATRRRLRRRMSRRSRTCRAPTAGPRRRASPTPSASRSPSRSSRTSSTWVQEAEIKHARVAMLAASGTRSPRLPPALGWQHQRAVAHRLPGHASPDLLAHCRRRDRPHRVGVLHLGHEGRR